MTLTTERQQFEEWAKGEGFSLARGIPVGCGNCIYVDGDTYILWQAWQASREPLANREAQPVYQYRMRNPYNDQVTDWEAIKPEQVDFILKETIAANVEFRIIAAPPAPAVPDDYFGELVKKARSAADKAMRKFPQPNYVLNKVAEESGEVIKAVIHYTEGREEWANVEGEIIDNLAMLIRLVAEGDQVIGFTPPDICRAAMLAAAPEGGK